MNEAFITTEYWKQVEEYFGKSEKCYEYCRMNPDNFRILF
jgi:ATP phosphoribosyltransferase